MPKNRTPRFFNYRHRNGLMEKAFVAFSIDPNHKILTEIDDFCDLAIIIRDAKMRQNLLFSNEFEGLIYWAREKLSKIEGFNSIKKVLEAMPDRGEPWEYLIERLCEEASSPEEFQIAAKIAFESYDSGSVLVIFKRRLPDFLKRAAGRQSVLLKWKKFFGGDDLGKHLKHFRSTWCSGEFEDLVIQVENMIIETLSDEELFVLASEGLHGLSHRARDKALKLLIEKKKD